MEKISCCCCSVQPVLDLVAQLRPMEDGLYGEDDGEGDVRYIIAEFGASGLRSGRHRWCCRRAGTDLLVRVVSFDEGEARKGQGSKDAENLERERASTRTNP